MEYDILIDPESVVWDYGTITLEIVDGEHDLFKVIRPDGYLYYIEINDGDNWSVLSNISNIPSDFTYRNYTYINGVWSKLPEPPTTGSTENIL